MILRLILMAIGIAGIVIFFLPLGKKGIANAGNIVGMILSVFVLLFGTFSWLFSRNFKIVLCVIALLILVLLIIVNVKMSKAKNNIATNQDVVIVLGCTYKYGISEELKNRIKEAARYLDKHPNALCIACGKVGNGYYDTEAEYIAVGLAKYGIAKSRIITEMSSTNTMENFKYAAQIINEKNLSRSLAVVTNDFHQYRAGIYASRCRLKAAAINVQTTKMMYPTLFVREVFAIIKCWISK